MIDKTIRMIQGMGYWDITNNRPKTFIRATGHETGAIETIDRYNVYIRLHDGRRIVCVMRCFDLAS